MAVTSADGHIIHHKRLKSHLGGQSRPSAYADEITASTAVDAQPQAQPASD